MISIGQKIRTKAVVLYAFVALVVLIILIILSSLQSQIKKQRIEIEKQVEKLSLTNELIYAIQNVQSKASLYISSKNTRYIGNFIEQIERIDFLIDTLCTMESVDTEKLRQMRHLLALQAANIENLNDQLDKENPIQIIRKRLESYEPVEHKDTIYVKRNTLDTIHNSSDRKGFFKRLGEAFRPPKNNLIVVNNERVDTLHIGSTDSIVFLSEVNQITNIASITYERTIRAIEKQVSNLITADREISTQLSEILLAFHKQTLDSVVATIDQSERTIGNNYFTSIIGGIIALILIFVFIILIIYDVNKGEAAKEEIRRLMETRHQLLLSVSHDIKSPLTSITTYLDLANKNGENVKSMQNSARHIFSLLENLLEFSSLEQGSLQTFRSDFSLKEMGDEIGEMFHPLAETKQLNFSFDTDSVKVHGDIMKIKQIIINLVSNAIKYTIKGHVNIEIRYKENFIIIDVNDSGSGIPEEKIQDLFKPFVRFEHHPSFATGSGLGMYVVKGLVDLLDGEIKVQSELEKGTQIQVLIPAEERECAYKTGMKKIAIFDDDPSIVEAASRYLIELGHRVQEDDYDIILTDYDMGDISGLDVLASAEDKPVILMTGGGCSEAQALIYGFSGYILKPFTLNDFRNVFGEGIQDPFAKLKTDDEIREIFRQSALDNFKLLHDTLTRNDFEKAQRICHKMHPMFAHYGYPTEALNRMDKSRGKEYPNWEKDINTILEITI